MNRKVILFTGDVHGDRERFKSPALRRLKKSDALIICGDFGCIWDGSKKEKAFLKRLGRRRYSILFVEGAHDNFAELEKYEIEEWCGGLTRKISGNLRQLIRGHVYEIAGKKVFAFGGGKNSDGGELPPGMSDALALKYEVPSERELADGLKRLENAGNAVDYVASYEPPAKMAEFLGFGTDTSTISAYLGGVSENVAFERWYFGKYHINKLVPTKFRALFDDISI